MGNGPSSLQTKINHAAYFSSLRSIDHDLQTITSNRSSSSTLVSVSAIQPGQQMKSTNPNPTTPFNSSSILQEANRVHCCSSKEFIRRSTFWKTVGAITGFFLIALFAALGHYMLVKGLNGTPLETSFLTQTQFSAVSILLSTIFKAALTASMGTCFAQHLWYILRGKAMSLSMVEMLFVIRNDLFALLSPQGIRRAPLLFLMALLIWSLGIAVIYPPGALTVSVRTQEFTEHHNMSIMNPPISPQLDFSGDESFPTLSRGDPLHGPDKVFSNFPLDPEVRKFIYIDKSLSQIPLDAGIRQFIYSGPSNRLVYLAQTIKNNNQISTFPNHPGENSTYNLQFRGPQFKCTTSEYNITLSAEYDPKEFVVPMWVSSWDDQKLIHSLTQYDIKTFNAHCRSNNSLVWNAYAVANEQVCESVSVLYNVSVTFPRGVQTVDYSISDARTLPRRVDIYDTIDISGAYDDPNLNPGKLYGIQLRLPSIPEALEEWHQKVSEAIPISNEWAILDSLMPFLDKEYFHSQYLPSDALSPPELLPLQRPMVLDGKCQQIEESPNSTDDLVRESWPGYLSYRGDPYLRGSVFHKSRYNEHEGLDPRHAFNLAENMLNGVLANITMSAISLGTWWDMVPVTSTRYSNTYTLSHPLNLVLPYSICLAAASVFVIISIWSLWCNRAPAADGGFLQIMLATMGNTEMSRIMLEEGVATIDDMSDELKSSKIRYGELVYEDELGKKGKRYGFGTAGEIISLGREDERV